MKICHIISLLSVLCLVGCGAPKQNLEEISNTYPGVAEEMSQVNLLRAQLMQQQGKYQSAIIEYLKILDSDVSELDIQQARLGVAKCLIKLGKFTSAIARLKPLPLTPNSDSDSQVLAVAGEAMLRLGKFQEAESVLEIALENAEIFSEYEMPEDLLDPVVPENIEETAVSTPLWIAPCAGNLGYAYLKNCKPIKAFLLYQQAAGLYARQGDSLACRKARRMADDLETIIRQYETCKSIQQTGK
jgi:tetratricopeptide (TPR) repeat protein